MLICFVRSHDNAPFWPLIAKSLRCFLRSRHTHWKQTVFYLEDTLIVNQGEVVEGVLKCSPNKKNPRDLDIKMTYNFRGKNMQASRTQQYRMR